MATQLPWWAIPKRQCLVPAAAMDSERRRGTPAASARDALMGNRENRRGTLLHPTIGPHELQFSGKKCNRKL
jgi:hypothetical protein